MEANEGPDFNGLGEFAYAGGIEVINAVDNLIRETGLEAVPHVISYVRDAVISAKPSVAELKDLAIEFELAAKQLNGRAHYLEERSKPVELRPEDY